MLVSEAVLLERRGWDVTISIKVRRGVEVKCECSRDLEIKEKRGLKRCEEVDDDVAKGK